MPLGMPLHKITLLCFGASYLLAFVCELAHLLWPRPVVRLVATVCGLAGLLAHTLFLAYHFFLAEQRLTLVSPFGSLVFLAWILAIFQVYGSVHHRRVAWGVFVLPLVLGLIGLAAAFPQDSTEAEPEWWHGEQFWRVLHGVLLLLAAVGVCVGFLASVMYLIQARRLRDKVPPGQGLSLLSLERLEEMNRRAVALAFPLLTAGVLVGLVLMAPHLAHPASWADPKILLTAGLWLVFALLVLLRYGYHLRGRRVAQLTIVAFVLLLCTLVASHTVVQEGGP
jgi:ABC-type transport system involved in cytochrome c biogenesis permease subunit